jgi:hypothetical protein
MYRLDVRVAGRRGAVHVDEATAFGYTSRPRRRAVVNEKNGAEEV